MMNSHCDVSIHWTNVERAQLSCLRPGPSVLPKLLCIFLLLVLGVTFSAMAQLPVARLSTIFPPGGKIGTSVEVRLSGLDLDDVAQLHFSRPGITAKPKMIDGASTPDPNRFLITIASDVSPGVCEVRAVGRFGISNPRAFVVGDLLEYVEKEPNDSASTPNEVQLGTVVNGTVESNTADYFKFTAKKAQRILIECLAKEIDSRMDPVLVLYDSDGHELERNRRGGLLDFVAKSDGGFIVKVYDFLYRGGDDYFYRLAIGNGPHIDFIFPPAGLSGSKAKYFLFGRNLPGSSPVPDLAIDGKPLEQLAVEIEMPDDAAAQYKLSSGSLIRPADSVLDGVDYRLTTRRGVSNPVLISFATAPVVVEQQPNDTPASAQKISVPCEYVGQYYPKGDQDWVIFEAKKGEVYWIEVFSQRLGLPSDPFVLVQRVKKNDKGEEEGSDLQELYDSDLNIGGADYNTATRDPAWRFDVKEDGTYRVQSRDLFNRSQSNPSLVYRLSIRKEMPDFRLVVMAQPPPPPTKDKKEAFVWTPFLRRGETMMMKVLAFRRDNFNGDIQLSVEGLPPGVTAAETKIEANKTSASLFLTASEGAAVWVGPIKVIGKAKMGDSDVVREARGGSINWTVADYTNEPVQSRMTRDFMLAISGKESAPISLEAAENKVWETSLAGKLKIPINLVRRGEFKDAVKLKAAGIAVLDPVKEIDVNGNTNTATLELDLTQVKVPVGAHTFYLQAQTKGKYRSLTPDEMKVVETFAKTADESAKQFEKEASELTASAKQATDALAAATKAAQEAGAREKAATEKLASAKTAAEATPAAESLVAARTAAEKESTEASAQSKTLAGAKSAAAKAAAEASDKAKNADAKKEAALKQANAAKEASKKAQPKDLNVATYSVPINLKITAAPINLSATTPSVPLAQGAKIEIPVTIKRLYEFNDPVELTLVAPKDANGLSGAKVTIPKDQSQAKFVVEAKADVKPGDYMLTLQAGLKLNSQDLKVDQLIALKVSAVEKTANK